MGFGAITGCTAATGVGLVTSGLTGAGALIALGTFEEPFEQPLVIKRNTPETAVTAIRPAPNRAFSLEREFLVV
jgi:hypothetical protein